MGHVDRSRSGAEETDVSITPPKTWVVGVPAVANPLRYSLEQTTVRRTALTLFNLNQTRGFDCRGCAWPEPELFARAFGTNNLPDCSNMCHESSGFALHETLGVSKGSVRLHDLHHIDLVLAVGQNPGSDHPRMLSALEETKRNGGRIVNVNPLPEAGLKRFKHPQKPRGVIGHRTVLADAFLQIPLGGDLALFQALNRLLLEAEDAAEGTVVDRAFIDTYTTGFESFADHVQKVSWEQIVAATGLTRPEIEHVHDMVPHSQRIIVCWAMGILPTLGRTERDRQAGGGHLLLQTLRSHDQWNTVPYTDNDRYRGVQGTRRVVLVSPADLTALGLSDGERVNLVSVWTDGTERRAEDFRLVAYPTAPGCAAAYCPETNVLVPLGSTAEISNTPTSKGIAVRPERTTTGAAGATATAPRSDGP